jgi:hypothetical protein
MYFRFLCYSNINRQFLYQEVMCTELLHALPLFQIREGNGDGEEMIHCRDGENEGDREGKGCVYGVVGRRDN